jgi:conjugal transfer ATP-binding protein TraC
MKVPAIKVPPVRIPSIAMPGSLVVWQKERAERPKRYSFEYGQQDPMDIISYAGMEESVDHVVVDGRYVRSITISGYPYIASSGWMNGLINFNHNVDISFHLASVEATIALPKLHRKITELESTKRSAIRSGRILGPEITDPLESAQELRDKILRGQEKLFQVSVYVCLSAETLAALNKLTQLLETALAARLFYTKIARYQQVEALQSILPRGEDILQQRRNLDSSSVALTFPFMSSELVQETGILYGINKSNNSLVILDRFTLHNANSIVFAQSGAGKSYAMKVEILRQLTQGTKVILIDPEREYQRLCESVGGTYVKLSAKSKHKINPFDLSVTGLTRTDIAEHVQSLTEVVSLMVDGMTGREKAQLDKALIALYQNGEQPILKDLYLLLKKTNQGQLCERLDKYVTGSLAGVFNARTNINLDNRLVVFDIKDLPETIRQISMMIISIFVQNQVKAKPEKRLLVIDEAWMLLEHEESARFIAGLTRRARKYYLGVSLISQQANDFLQSEYGRAIASQSSLRILMRQDTTTIEMVVRHFHLSEYEENFLLTCERGDALLIGDQNHVAVKIVASEEEHPLITTNPAELYHL